MKPKHETVCVVGLGYVGLPTAAILASRGFDVLGVDVNVETVALINQGKVNIVEPDLDILVNGAVARASSRPLWGRNRRAPSSSPCRPPSLATTSPTFRTYERRPRASPG